MTRTHFLRTLAALAGCVALAATAALAPSTAASALGSRTVNVELLDTTDAGSAAGAQSALVIDPASHRAYFIDSAHKVRVLDISGNSIVAIASIATTIEPASLALDVQSHHLFVGDFRSPSVAMVDIDPNSASVNTVLKVFASGAASVEALGVDGDIAYAADRSENVSRVDLRDGSWANTPVSVGSNSPKSIAVDHSLHTTYVSDYKSKTVLAFAQDGTHRSLTISGVPFLTGITRGQLAVGRLSNIGSLSNIEIYDPVTLTLQRSSPRFPNLAAIASDDGLGILYAASDTAISMLESDSLAVIGTIPTPNPAIAVAVESSSQKVLVLETGSATAKIEMYGVSPTVSRVEGADRFEVSAAVSRGQFAAPAPVAYVASGGVFSDALSASAAAGAEGGPVLLVQKDKIPDAIATELTRLKPARIVVMGGTATIDATVENALKAYSPNVSRIGGADRFEVSAAVSQAVFGPMRPVAYVAAGATFPDALSGSAAAGKLGGPVLLTGKDSLPASVETELRRLAPAKIVVLGGANSVSQAVVDTLTGIQAATTRVAGADRFEVSAAVSAATFAPNPKVVYVASGLGYADALSGSAVAIANSAPVLLVATDSIPAAVATELKRLKPTRIVVLGGPNSVSPAVEEALRGYIA